MALFPGAAYKDDFDIRTPSDLTLSIGERCIYVHRILLSSHSAYLNKLLTSVYNVRDSLALHFQDLD